MTIKEKIIRRAIKETEKQISRINFILNANPISDIINLRRETFAKVKKMDNKSALAYITRQAKKEAAYFKIGEQQKDTIKLVDKKVKLILELSDLKNELSWIERKF